MVQICLSCIPQRFMWIRTTICAREKPSSFFDLQSMLMVEENHASESRTTQSDSRMMYTDANRPSRRGGCDQSACNGGGRQEQERRHRKPTSKGWHRMLVLWQKGPQRERVSTSGIRLAKIQWPEGPNLWRLSAREATPNSFPQWEKSEPYEARLNPFRYVGTGIECEPRRESIFCLLHRRL